jgi:uncharacterized membrane protein
MDDFAIARVVHVVAVLFWIGGVGFVTLVLLPWIESRHGSGERLGAFHSIEGRFAPQARLWVALALLSGLWMAYRGGFWSRFAEVRFWWMHAMVFVWIVFALMLFVIEPLGLHRRMQASLVPAQDFGRLVVGHRVLLAISFIALVGAVGGSHGLF